LFNQAMDFLKRLAQNGGTVLFVGTKKQAGEIIAEQAARAGAPFVSHRWLGGMLTNWRTVRKSIERLKTLESTLADPMMTAKLVKKEVLELDRERVKLEKSLGGIKNMDRLPDALFVIDVGHEYIAISEANKLNIPVVAIVDSNCKPDGVDYIVPGNDDAIRAIRLYAGAAADAVIEGSANRQEALNTGDDDFVEVRDGGEPKVKVVARRKPGKADGAAEVAAEADDSKPKGKRGGPRKRED
jgi:small subunit ribosomal protein S2